MTAPLRRPDTATGCDTREMVVVHRFLRHLLAGAPGLVRAVRVGDTARAGVVAEHVAEVASSLHHHHHGEDLLLWDRLESRAPACALHVGRMRAQHAAVAERIAVLEDALPAWAATAGEAEREAVAAAIESVDATLAEHLGDEEGTILPVVATTFTQAEWDALGEHARRGIPKSRLLIQLGWMLESMPPGEGEAFLRRSLPPPVRVVWRLVGRRRFDAYRRRLVGAA